MQLQTLGGLCPLMKGVLPPSLSSLVADMEREESSGAVWTRTTSGDGGESRLKRALPPHGAKPTGQTGRPHTREMNGLV